MDLNQFVAKFSEQFEDTDASAFEAGTQFRDLDEWSSLTALFVIAMADDEYGVKITGDEIKNANTIEDLYNLISSKK
ncbi:MAG: acyl carrier protein [Mucilaginibacter polytrichastri]|nr:acyl carrier protein [Mucilaginibacter polytrichastri]